MLLTTTLVALGFVVDTALGAPTTGVAPTVQLGKTTVTGQAFPQFGLEFFGGIPFAEAPLGSLRFAPPKLKLTPGVTQLDATAFGPDCIQFGEDPASEGITEESEDCLFVNVFRPAGVSASARLPVMTWVYGGGFIFGGSSIYNATAIVAESILRGTPTIVASINYRVGPFGFPQGAEAQSKNAVNLGAKDVETAFKWIQANIGTFGGDHTKVTVFGQSAGSILISYLLLNPDFNLARAAILESGFPATQTLFNPTRRQGDWDSFISNVPECKGVSRNNAFGCLRSASSDTILNAGNAALAAGQEEFPYSPVIDGWGGIIPDLPSKLFAAGHFARLPILTGTCLDEGTDFTLPTINSQQQVETWVRSNLTPPAVSEFEFNKDVDTVLRLYPNDPALGSPFNTGNDTFGLNAEFKRMSAINGDDAFQSLRRSLTELFASHGLTIFAYLFTDPQPSKEPFFGVTHASEVPYVFGAPANGPASEVLSSTIINYWLSFANSLTPNDGKGDSTRPLWTQYTTSSKKILELNSANLSMIPDTYRAEQIGFFQANPLSFRH